MGRSYHFDDLLAGLKLYCGYKYTRHCMINRIWGLKQLWLQVNGHAWSHLHGIHWAVRTKLGLNIQNKNICLIRYSNPCLATSDRWISALDRLATTPWWWCVDWLDSVIKSITSLRDNTCQSYYGFMCIWTVCQTKSIFLISIKILANIITVYRTLHCLSNHNRFHICFVAYPFVLKYQDTVRL